MNLVSSSTNMFSFIVLILTVQADYHGATSSQGLYVSSLHCLPWTCLVINHFMVIGCWGLWGFSGIQWREIVLHLLRSKMLERHLLFLMQHSSSISRYRNISMCAGRLALQAYIIKYHWCISFILFLHQLKYWLLFQMFFFSFQINWYMFVHLLLCSTLIRLVI